MELSQEGVRLRAPQGAWGKRLMGRLLMGSALSVAFALPAAAQTNTPQPSAEQVLIQGEAENYKMDDPALVKLTEPLVDTPQSIDSISNQELADRAATNLNDALRNVPGITLGAGEFMWQGNNPTIRGFTARNDMYLDGMLDFGSYYRDPFDLEEVEVLEGPSSILFGRGSTGGVINQVSKTPQLQPLIDGTASFGTDLTRRVTADIDEPINGLPFASAFRVDVMGDEGGVAGRDVTKANRYGFAPSVAFGLGTPTRVTLSYFHQTADDVPDYGLPWYFGSPAPVPSSNFYGFSTDYLDTDVDIGTLKVEHDFGDGITIRDQLREADYTRQERLTQATLPTTVTTSTPLADIDVTRNVYSGHSQEQVLDNTTDLLAKFATGPVQHDFVAGVEFAHERSAPEFDNSTGVPSTSLLDPDDPSIFVGQTYERFHADTKANEVGVYAEDTAKIGSQWEITLGARWDQFTANYLSQAYSVPPATTGIITGSNDQDHTDSMPSYRAAIVYKPETNGSVYFTYGTSFDPSSESLTFLTSGETFNVGNEFLSPVKTRSYEAGTKWDLFSNALSLTGALFRVEQYNARIPDPNNPGFNILAGDSAVNGMEILFEGRITDNWQISGGYDYLDSEVIKSAPGGAALGTQLTLTPKNALTFWSTYAWPEGFVIGGGGRFVDKRLAQNTAPIETAPSYWEFDAMAKYLLTSNISVQLNVNNIANAVYYDQLHAHFVIPGAGRSAMLSLEFKY